MICFVTDQKRNFEKSELDFENGNGGEMKIVKVLADTEFQTYMGMGGAFTEASAFVWSKMSAASKEKLINLYFGKDGNNYSLCRSHIQSCDFALGNYSYVENSSDENLETFQIDRDRKYLLPLIKASIAKNNEIELLSSPWSPPAFMKTNEEMNHGGKLKSKYFSAWAKIIAKYIVAYKNEGINVTRITVQNEPAAVQSWDSCLYSAKEESDFAVKYLKPALLEAGLDYVKINIWDHNKELLLERARESLISNEAKNAIDGIAFHWYTGDHFEQIVQTKNEFSDKELIFTEGCVEYSRFKDESEISKAERYAHDILGNFNAGANAFIDWNIFLDKEGGPNHVGNFCDAPVMCNTETDEIRINKSYYYIGHFSRFIKKGAKRIFVSRFTDKIECTAFKNSDNTIVMVVLNKGDENVDFTLSHSGKNCLIKSTGHSIMTLIF